MTDTGDCTQSGDASRLPDMNEAAVLRLGRAVGEALQTAVSARQQTIDRFGGNLPKVVDALKMLADAVAVTVAYYPRNLVDMAIVPDEDELIRAAQQGFAVMWVPRSEILDEFFAVDTVRARGDVLLRRKDDVLDDCSAVLKDVVAAPLNNYRLLLARAIEASREGHDEAAQALAANVLDGLRKNELQKSVRTLIGRGDAEKIAALGIRGGVVYTAMLSAFARWYPGDPIPDDLTFSRNITAHTVEPTQYTPMNSLSAVMHASAVLRQVHGDRMLAID